MTRVLDFRPRNARVRAMRIIIGETTKPQILDFAPEANVGVSVRNGIDKETDIRWVVVSNGLDSEPAEMQENGDWLVRLGSGRYEFRSDAEFHAEYEPNE